MDSTGGTDPATRAEPARAAGAGARRARRDPSGRRRAIIEAAADLIAEQGAVDLTHRRVAARAGVPLGATTYYFSSLEELSTEALRLLARRQDDQLAGIRRTLEGGADPDTLAAALHDYLCGTAQVYADMALYVAGARDPALRPLALSWFDDLVGILSAHTDPDSARAIAVYLDGATVHAVLHDEPLDRAALSHAIAPFLARTAASSEASAGPARPAGAADSPTPPTTAGTPGAPHEKRE
ncbi:DNA-binding transcriptional regulator YbjK [Streptomonospora nanhaiensis]|uniref:DNA-binding transcriptional regulator YbjK n=1 Tax=Streptomonospora nanhaiensis TaxID=1323731 RepID=A0A853BXA4_9ACTN|nr:TetR family transcriptional regulator [Streptomonospora nanhaiensis]NYI99121.1 DNA-binding transcriptional regulator YbjK [Streptomonospora nanhaiensis]